MQPLPSKPSPFDVSALPDDQLTALISAAQTLLAERHAKRQADFLASVRIQATELGLDAAAVAAALRKRAASGAAQGADARSTVKPKYRNPATSETWAGRGKPPQWIELGADNKPLPKFRIE